MKAGQLTMSIRFMEELGGRFKVDFAGLLLDFEQIPNFLTVKEPKDRFQGINSPPAYVTWRAGKTTLFLLGSYSPQRLFKNSSTAQFLVVLYTFGRPYVGDTWVSIHLPLFHTLFCCQQLFWTNVTVLLTSMKKWRLSFSGLNILCTLFLLFSYYQLVDLADSDIGGGSHQGYITDLRQVKIRNYNFFLFPFSQFLFCVFRYWKSLWIMQI